MYDLGIIKEKSLLIQQGIIKIKDGFRYATNFLTASMINC